MRFLISAALEGTMRRLSLTGELDMAACPELIKSIEEALGDEATDGLVIDLADLTFLDCTGIGALVHGENLAAERGRGYEIRHAHGLPLKILLMTGALRQT